MTLVPCSSDEYQLRELVESYDILELSMEKMSVKWGSAINSMQTLPGKTEERGAAEREVEDNFGDGRWDQSYSHSWTPGGPGSGWYWIPKGRLSLDLAYPASRWDIQRFGHLARTVS